MTIDRFFRRALGAYPSGVSGTVDAVGEAGTAPEFDDVATRLHIELRLALFRLEGADPDEPEWGAATAEIASLRAALSSLAGTTPGAASSTR
ncbi:MAG: hypothetical protein IVW53_14515 [Chloroflexi bacterium]|nr:hypothetical protein [Chloroflexota bacterium]MBF6606779.1 hypothetical protein [Chloroflexota bacterium]